MNHTHHFLRINIHRCLTQSGSKIISASWWVEWREKHHHHHPSYPLQTSKFSPFYSLLIPLILCRLQKKASPHFFVLVLTLLCLHICRLLLKLTLIYGVLVLSLLFMICRNFDLDFGVLILSLLCNVCEKYALIYGFLCLPILCRICQKSLIRGVLVLPLLCRLHKKNLLIMVSWYSLSSVCTYVDFFKKLIFSVVPLSFLSSTGFVKKKLCILVSSSFLSSASFIKNSFFVVVSSSFLSSEDLFKSSSLSSSYSMITSGLGGGIRGRCGKEKMWWLIWQKPTSFANSIYARSHNNYWRWLNN